MMGLLQMALTDTDDILQVFEHRDGLFRPLRGGEEIDFDETERQVLAALPYGGPFPAEDLMLTTGLPLPKLLHTLLRLHQKAVRGTARRLYSLRAFRLCFEI